MTNPPVPEMADCRNCIRHVVIASSSKCCSFYKCVDGNYFIQAEPIRLYQITSEDKT